MDSTLTIEALRRERRLLTRLKRFAFVLGWAQILACLWLVIGESRRDAIFFFLSFYGTITNLSGIVIFKVRAIPRLVEALLNEDVDVAARARATVAAHKHEVLATTELPAHRDEPDLVDMPLEAVAARLARVGPRTDWRRVGRVWLVAWSVGFVAVAIVTVSAILGPPHMN